MARSTKKVHYARKNWGVTRCGEDLWYWGTWGSCVSSDYRSVTCRVCLKGRKRK